MNVLIYAGVFSFGAIALLIEARRNYRESLKQAPFQRHPILHNARVDDLCTPRDGFVGFVIYSLLYLVSYVVILCSAELYSLIQDANLAKLEVGATTPFDPLGGDPFNIQGTVYAKPIFVSAFLIAVMSVGAMRPIENTVRSAAHRLAGIPRGVYRVIDTLQTPAFQTLTARRSGPLLSHFRDKLKTHGSDPDIHDLAGHKVDIEQALGAIDVLSPAVSPNKRAKFFPASELDKLTQMAEDLQVELDQLRAELRDFTPSDESLEAFQIRANTVANNVKALFAVHYIRNNRSLKNLEHGTLLDRAVAVIDRNYNPEQNSIAMALFVAAIAGAVCNFILLSQWQEDLATSYPSQLETQMSAAIIGAANRDVIKPSNPVAPDTGQAPQSGQGDKKQQDLPTASSLQTPAARCAEVVRTYFQNDKELTDLPPMAPDSDPDTTPAASLDPETKLCLDVFEQSKVAFLDNIKIPLVREALWETFQGALVTLLAVVSAAFGREVRLEQESWKRGWKLTRMPFLRLFGLCLVPAVLAVIGSITGEFMKLAYDAGPMNLTQTQILDFFRDNAMHFSLMMPIGFVLAFATLIILDKHDDYYNEVTVMALGGAAVFAIVAAFWLVVFVTYSDQSVIANPESYLDLRQRDILRMAFVPAAFMLCFSIFIEMTEDDKVNGTEEQWLWKRILFGKTQTTQQETT